MNELEKILNEKLTENGDLAYKSTGSELLDILFMSPYFERHLDEVSIGTSNKEKLFSMFMRDPRYGLGRRDLGRELMKKSGVPPKAVVTAGRFDDLLMMASDAAISFWKDEIAAGNGLAKKWAPRLTGKYSKLAKALARSWGMSEKEYRKFIKYEDTVEYKLAYAEAKDTNALERAFGVDEYTHPLVDTIDFEHVPSLAMIKYFNTFKTREDLAERFAEYLAAVEKGEKKLNVATSTVYDIYKNRDKIDADLFFDKIEKISISCIPVVDTSGSMYWGSEDAAGKALAIGHYLAKCSTFCNGYVVPFSSMPHLMKISGKNYKEEIDSLYTGDCSNTDLGAVMELFKDLDELPEYLVILSDMEFDSGSSIRKDDLMKLWEKNGYTTKIVWWNFNGRNKTVPETDDYGNIYLSGYSPMLLKYLEVGFDGNAFLNKLLKEYASKLKEAIYKK